MTIENIKNQALKQGCLTPLMEAEISRLCEMERELSFEEKNALDEIMSALKKGDIVASNYKKFINVMEDLVLSRALTLMAEVDITSSQSFDVGDITAYALNRLPPLYATTVEGASYQKQRAEDKFQQVIDQRVEDAINHHMMSNQVLTDRQALGTSTSNEVVDQISNLLQNYAEQYENE